MRALLAISMFFFALQVQAQGLLWPAAAAPCNTTLQACVNGASPGFTVLIATDTPTNVIASGNFLQLNQSIHLVAAAGYRPVFPVGVGIQISASGNASFTVAGLTLRNRGVLAVSGGGGATTLVVRDVRIDDSAGNGGFTFSQIGAGTMNVHAEHNRYQRTGSGAGLGFQVDTFDGTVNADLRFNEVDLSKDHTSAYGMVGATSGNGTARIDFSNNIVRGTFSYGALCGVMGSSASATSSLVLRAYGNIVTPGVRGVGTGICAFGGEGTSSAYLINNTLVDLGLGAYLGVRPFTPPTVTQAMQGYLANNLITLNQTAVVQQALASAVTNTSNLLFANGANGSGFTPHASSVFSDPALISRERPYLASNSAAIGQGNGFAIVFAPGTALPLLDADGHRRLKGGTIDIGAYEYGDAWFLAVSPASQPTSNSFAFTHPSVDGDGSARLQASATPIAGTSLLAPFGVYRSGATPTWAMFAQNPFVVLGGGVGFNLFAAATGSGSFLHQTASSTSSSQIDNTSVNGNPDAMVFVTSNWNPSGGSGVYNDHPIGVYTYADNNWYVQTGDGSSLSNGAAFNVYTQNASPNVFRLDPGADSILSIPPGQAVEIPVDEIAVACAVVVFTPWASSNDGRNYDIYRRPNGRWAIYSPTGIADGTRFNVMYSPRQVFECAGPMFRDSFE